MESLRNNIILAGMKSCLGFIRFIAKENDGLVAFINQYDMPVVEREIEGLDGEVFRFFYKKDKEIAYSITDYNEESLESSHQFSFYEKGMLSSTVTFTTASSGHIVKAEIARDGDKDFSSKRLVVSEIPVSEVETLLETSITFNHFVSDDSKPDYQRYFSLSQSGLENRTAVLSETSKESNKRGSLAVSYKNFLDTAAGMLDFHPVEGEYSVEELSREHSYEAIADLVSNPRVNDLFKSITSVLDESACDISFLNTIGNFAELEKVDYNPKAAINNYVENVIVSDCNRLEEPRTPGAPAMEIIFEGQANQD